MYIYLLQKACHSREAFIDLSPNITEDELYSHIYEYLSQCKINSQPMTALYQCPIDSAYIVILIMTHQYAGKMNVHIL